MRSHLINYKNVLIHPDDLLKETGVPVELGFEYSSGNNTVWLENKAFLNILNDEDSL